MMDDTDGRLLLTFTLCMRCRFGDRCPGMQKAPAAGGGITCLAYEPQRTPKRARMKRERILALPDREPCAGCACRKGSEPNGTHHSLAEFTQCVEDGEPFLCHAEGANRVCAGWLRAAKGPCCRRAGTGGGGVKRQTFPAPERHCYWMKDENGDPVLIPQCWGSLYDPSQCTCSAAYVLIGI